MLKRDAAVLLLAALAIMSSLQVSPILKHSALPALCATLLSTQR